MDAGERRRLGSKYLIGQRIGHGGMGIVYEGTVYEGTVSDDTAAGERVAIKLLRPELAEHPRTVAMFVQERAIFEQISHPNVVSVHDLVVEGRDLGIVMEYVPDGDLRQRMEAGRIAPIDSLRIAADIAGGLSAIHGNDVVHRDLKPANILLEDGPLGIIPKISDFGISRLAGDALTKTSSTIGTPVYMAPEVSRSEPVGRPADIYSLGVILFELLTGSPPFHKGGTMAIITAHATIRPPRIEGVPDDLADLIDQMLAKDPLARPTAIEVQSRLTELGAYVDGQTVARSSEAETHRVGPMTIMTPRVGATPTEDPPAPESDRPGGRRAPLLLAIGAAAVVLAAGLAAVITRPWADDDAAASDLRSSVAQDQSASDDADAQSVQSSTEPGAPTLPAPSSSTTSTTTTTATAESPPTTAETTSSVTTSSTSTTTISATTATSPPSTPVIVPSGPVVWSGQLVGFGNKCLDVRGPSRNNGTPVQIWDCVGVPQQTWNLTESGELRGYENKCLDVRGPSSDNGTPVQIWDCVDVPQQTWQLTDAGQLVGYQGLCLDVRGPSRDNGTPVQVWDCVGVANQVWSQV